MTTQNKQKCLVFFFGPQARIEVSKIKFEYIFSSYSTSRIHVCVFRKLQYMSIVNMLQKKAADIKNMYLIRLESR